MDFLGRQGQGRSARSEFFSSSKLGQETELEIGLFQ